MCKVLVMVLSIGEFSHENSQYLHKYQYRHSLNIRRRRLPAAHWLCLEVCSKVGLEPRLVTVYKCKLSTWGEPKGVPRIIIVVYTYIGRHSAVIVAS